MNRTIISLLCLTLAGGVAADPPGLSAVNAFRQDHGRESLSYSEDLESIARNHAESMARRGVMTHEGADGSGPGDRARAAGYSWCRIAENVAEGQRSQEAVIEGWSHSPGHRENMLNAEVSEMGLARAQDDFWVMLLARPGC